MKDFRPIWKDLAHRKDITCRAVIQHIILRTMRSKSEDKQAVLNHLLHKAFSPRNYDTNPYRAISATNAEIYESHAYYGLLLGVAPFDILETNDEWNEFNKLAQSVRNNTPKLIRHYSYFFTRQDISPEYQLVQTAHAALELGARLQPEQVKNLHFTCVGVANLEELEEVESLLNTLGKRFITFVEPDIGNTKTAIAVEPIAENRRGVLRNYPLLTFKENT